MIETRDMNPLIKQPMYKALYGDDIEDKYPVSKWINENGFYIGCHQELTEDDVKYVIRKFHEFFEKI